MAREFHENFSRDDGILPSERSTGFVFTAVAVIVAVLWRNSYSVLWAAVGIAAVLLASALWWPSLLKPLNLVWFRFGMLLHRIVNPLVMLAIFVLVFLPAGLLMRIWYDPLRSRRATATPTYWIDYKDGDNVRSSMTRQF